MKIYGSQAGVYYFINDHLGTPQKIVDSSAQVVWAAAYLPFGKAQVKPETITNNLRFPGQYFDSESGLHYNWNRYYESAFKQDTREEDRQKKRSKYLLMILIFVGMIYIISGTPLIGTAYYKMPRKDSETVSRDKKGELSKDDIRRLVGSRRFTNIAAPYLNVKVNDRHLHIKTTIDPELQKSVLNTLNPTASRYMSVVVMNPTNGKILSMVSYDRDNRENNTCVGNRFPAASIFKIITAAAAIEKCGFDTKSEISFVGRKHTLYNLPFDSFMSNF